MATQSTSDHPSRLPSSRSNLSTTIPSTENTEPTTALPRGQMMSAAPINMVLALTLMPVLAPSITDTKGLPMIKVTGRTITAHLQEQEDNQLLKATKLLDEYPQRRISKRMKWASMTKLTSTISRSTPLQRIRQRAKRDTLQAKKRKRSSSTSTRPHQQGFSTTRDSWDNSTSMIRRKMLNSTSTNTKPTSLRQSSFLPVVFVNEGIPELVFGDQKKSYSMSEPVWSVPFPYPTSGKTVSYEQTGTKEANKLADASETDDDGWSFQEGSDVEEDEDETNDASTAGDFADQFAMFVDFKGFLQSRTNVKLFYSDGSTSNTSSDADNVSSETLSFPLPPLWEEMKNTSRDFRTVVFSQRSDQQLSFDDMLEDLPIVSFHRDLHCHFSISCNYSKNKKMYHRCDKFIQACFRDLRRCFHFTYAAPGQFRKGIRMEDWERNRQKCQEIRRKKKKKKRELRIAREMQEEREKHEKEMRDVWGSQIKKIQGKGAGHIKKMQKGKGSEKGQVQEGKGRRSEERRTKEMREGRAVERHQNHPQPRHRNQKNRHNKNRRRHH
ncbi:unnamed protein product [Cyprideis torosa]|uniref:Uncharacterized protein n=1 Tax=Cyprideis torosa TaxID=163714 RepID=A0A7R8WP12_9CRUS|nr:unnamed protein product [Cyprideis torosa]CAG0904621.1 unnamed protein product [Cyprideis torosa]